MTQASELKGLEFTEPTTIRLITTSYIDEPPLQPLADSDADLTKLEEIEGLTSARQSRPLLIPDGVNPAELLSEADGHGWTYVNAAFCHTRITGNRFNGSRRGAWYAAYGELAVETAHAEVSWHLTRELEATGVFENITAYHEILAGFTGRFHSLNGRPGEMTLNSDPDLGYPAGQILARDVLASGGNGLLYPSARHQDGQCIVALRPHLVQNIRQGATWVFQWAGEPTPAIFPSKAALQTL